MENKDQVMNLITVLRNVLFSSKNNDSDTAAKLLDVLQKALPMPFAGAEILSGVKVDESLSIANDGTLSTEGGSGSLTIKLI